METPPLVVALEEAKENRFTGVLVLRRPGGEAYTVSLHEGTPVQVEPGPDRMPAGAAVLMTDRVRQGVLSEELTPEEAGDPQAVLKLAARRLSRIVRLTGECQADPTVRVQMPRRSQTNLVIPGPPGPADSLPPRPSLRFHAPLPPIVPRDDEPAASVRTTVPARRHDARPSSTFSSSPPIPRDDAAIPPSPRLSRSDSIAAAAGPGAVATSLATPAPHGEATEGAPPRRISRVDTIAVAPPPPVSAPRIIGGEASPAPAPVGPPSAPLVPTAPPSAPSSAPRISFDAAAGPTAAAPASARPRISVPTPGEWLAKETYSGPRVGVPASAPLRSPTPPPRALRTPAPPSLRIASPFAPVRTTTPEPPPSAPGGPSSTPPASGPARKTSADTRRVALPPSIPPPPANTPAPIDEVERLRVAAKVKVSLGDFHGADRLLEARSPSTVYDPELQALALWIKANVGGDLEGPLESLNLLVHGDPHAEHALFYRGLVLKKSGQRKAALRDFVTVAKQNPKHALALFEIKELRSSADD